MNTAEQRPASMPKKGKHSLRHHKSHVRAGTMAPAPIEAIHIEAQVTFCASKVSNQRDK